MTLKTIKRTILCLKLRQLLALIGLAALSFSPAHGLAAVDGSAAKKNICSITINSDDEINAFKKYLSPNQFNFIELTQFGNNKNKNSSEWLTRACERGIQCDVLVVSGHFGGAFFGSSGKRLSLEDLEMASCNSQCHGILNKPKEVFLFGCNTLAGKDKDSRTPEQYNRILIEDGFSPAQAAQIVAFRYSPIGQSFHDRMAQVFGGVDRLYGFSSAAPVGENTRPLLQQYLSSKGKTYSQLLDEDSAGSSQSVAINQNLLTIFKRTSMVQSQGSREGMSRLKPVCFLADKKTSSLDKLVWVDSVLRNSDSGFLLNTIVSIQNFITDFLRSPSTNEAEKSVFSRLSQSQSGREEVLALLKHPMPGLTALQVNLLSFAKELGWVSAADFKIQLEKVIQLTKTLQRPIKIEYRDFVCSLSLTSTDLDLNQIPSTRWSEELFISLLGCLKPQNLEIQKKLAKNLLQDKDMDIQAASVFTLKELKPHDIEIQKALLTTVLSHGNANMRSYAASAFAKIKIQDASISAGLINALQKDKSKAVRVEVARTLAEQGFTDSAATQALLWTLLQADAEEVRQAAGEALGKIKPQDVSVLKAMVKVLSSDDFISVKRSVAEALAQIKSPDSEVRSLIENDLRKSSDKETRDSLTLSLK